MEYIAPTRHTRVLSDVLGLSRQLPAERRSAIAPLSALLSLVGLLVYAAATPEAQGQPHMRLLRCVRALRIFRLAQVGW